MPLPPPQAERTPDTAIAAVMRRMVDVSRCMSFPTPCAALRCSPRRMALQTSMQCRRGRNLEPARKREFEIRSLVARSDEVGRIVVVGYGKRRGKPQHRKTRKRGGDGCAFEEIGFCGPKERVGRAIVITDRVCFCCQGYAPIRVDAPADSQTFRPIGKYFHPRIARAISKIEPTRDIRAKRVYGRNPHGPLNTIHTVKCRNRYILNVAVAVYRHALGRQPGVLDAPSITRTV